MVTLEYAIPPRPMIGRKITAMLTLILGTAAYAALCWPAMHRRGYPPMDHFWLGMAYLWVFPIPLFTLICPPGGFSRWVLAAYALTTAFVDACTVVWVVPHQFDPFEGLMSMPFCGPIHMVGVAAIASTSRLIFRVVEIAPELNADMERRNARRIVSALAVLAAAVAFPYVFGVIAIAIDLHNGAVAADAAWADHSACMLAQSQFCDVPRQVGNYDIINYFDAGSGLPLRREMGHEWEPGYRARIRELLAIHGVPLWSHKQQIVSDTDLLGMFTAKDMTLVTTYPYDISPNAALMRGGTLSRWGATFSSGSNSPCVETRLSGSFVLPNYNGDAAIGRLKKYPGVIFVRGGDQWVVAVSDDGWVLIGAMVSP